LLVMNINKFNVEHCGTWMHKFQEFIDITFFIDASLSFKI
jgi:hypothetical protein